MIKRTKLPTVKELNEHAYALCKAFDVILLEDPSITLKPESAVAFQLFNVKEDKALFKSVQCAPIVDEATYAVALHEIGHCIAPNGSLLGLARDPSNYGLRLLCERTAWEWAKYYSLDWSPTMEQNMLMALGTYEEGYRRWKDKQNVAATAERAQPVRDEKALKNWLKKVKI